MTFHTLLEEGAMGGGQARGQGEKRTRGLEDKGDKVGGQEGYSA